MANKKTLRDYFTELLSYDLSDEHRSFVEGRLAALDRKTTERKPTAAQIASEKLAAAVYEELLADGRELRVSEMMKVLPSFMAYEDLSQSKANAIIKKLKDTGRVIKVEEKGVAYFHAVEVEGE